MGALEISGLGKRFGDVPAVNDFSLNVSHGEFVSLLGPSGCGKSTILRIVAGLLEPDEGLIRVADRDVTWLPTHKRQIGLVFQSYALFPHMSVFENVAFGLRQQRMPADAIRERVHEALALVQLAGLEGRMPHALSGGQQQRVALARSIAPRPSLLLLDEPLSNLDAKLRDAMRIEIRRLQQELSITTLFVTHDQEEALTMSDRICVLSGGVLQQIGEPREIYDHPATAFVAEFFGRSNVFNGSVTRAGTVFEIALEDGMTVRANTPAMAVDEGQNVRVAVRREAINVSETALDAHPNTLRGRLELVSFAGANVQFVVRTQHGVEFLAEAAAKRGGDMMQAGDEVYLGFASEDVIVTPCQ